MTDEELAEIERVWSAASGTQWRVERTRDRYVKLYAVNDPMLHDSYLMDLSSFDANGGANLDAIASAPEHIATLLAEVERLRAAGPQWTRERPAVARKRPGRPAASAEGAAVMVSLRLRPEVRRALAEAGRRYGSQSEAIAQALGALARAG